MEAIINPKENAPELFRNKFLNRLTRSNPILIFVMYAIIATTLICIGMTEFGLSAGKSAIFFFIGLLSWSFAEYLLHRFFYHKISDASYDKGLQYVFHGIHHGYPSDKTKIVLPPVPSLLIAGILFSLFYLMMGRYAFSFGPGFMIGYSLYMWIHYIVHVYPMPKRFNFWWKHHNIHHYQQHDRAFGVSSPVWDYVFQTMPEPDRITIKIVVNRKNS